ncbi:uncharacterized protein LOC106537072 [Austrofundulus limnaeus]|uniref:Uncharacterized protein LOC106537072 n=1 Tax=Austrofundulus limnaeus TaxID=52670 RepID=A0A2I4DCD1_AUSLI|nr:PREDICTED: uncharacterized protein LOC106537072 [Austrofundulus limnaeus]
MTSSLLLLLLLAAQTAAADPVNNTGTSFIAVFPENIAYYHPTNPQNQIWVTALYNATTVTVSPTSSTSSPQLSVNQSQSFDLDQELMRNLSVEAFGVSNSVVNITSDKQIVVQAFSIKKKSVQTAVLVPTDKLGTKYFIPPVPVISGTTDDPNVNVTERSPFRLIIINPTDTNTVTVKGSAASSVTLQPGQVSQSWVPNNQVPRWVEAEKPIAVLFSHPCAMQTNCTCGLLTAMLPPARNQTVRFPVPSVLAQNASVLLSDGGSREAKPFNPDSDSAVVQSSGTAILYRPGLLLTLIPETEFASCFSIFTVPSKTNFAIIVVLKDSTSGIYVGNSLLDAAVWQDLKGTEYVSTNYSLTQNTVIWHNSSKMAVYVVGYEGSDWFGNPAPVISTTPDYRGCPVNAERLTVYNTSQGWRESLQSCQNLNLDLISLSESRLQRHVCLKLQQDSDQKVWIGMRRSSKTGNWYWLSRAPVRDTNWGSGEPGRVDEGQCAAMSVRSNCTWSDEDCCSAFQSVCYKEADYLVRIN